MAIPFPSLPYSFDSLEPFISKKSLQFHFEQTHGDHVRSLNDLIKNTTYDKLLLEEVIFESAQNHLDRAIFNQSTEAWNHSFFWRGLAPVPQEPSIRFRSLIENQFDSWSSFLDLFKGTANGLFGSGWIWLVKNEKGQLSLLTLPNSENPATSGQTPLLACDLWEHAYYLDYQNRRQNYLEGFLKRVSWSFVETNHNISPLIFHSPFVRQTEFP
jgi:Fe-Mn family superoxide dismutase